MAGIHGVILGNAPALASELVLNGGFDSTSDWTQTLSEWVISGGVATYTAGTGTNIRQTIGAVGITGSARVVYTINSVTGGNVYFTISHSGGSVSGTLRGAAGTYTEDVYVGGEITLLRFNCTGTDCVIDDVSMRQHL